MDAKVSMPRKNRRNLIRPTILLFPDFHQERSQLRFFKTKNLFHVSAFFFFDGSILFSGESFPGCGWCAHTTEIASCVELNSDTCSSDPGAFLGGLWTNMHRSLHLVKGGYRVTYASFAPPGRLLCPLFLDKPRTGSAVSCWLPCRAQRFQECSTPEKTVLKCTSVQPLECCAFSSVVLPCFRRPSSFADATYEWEKQYLGESYHHFRIIDKKKFQNFVFLFSMENPGICLRTLWQSNPSHHDAREKIASVCAFV